MSNERQTLLGRLLASALAVPSTPASAIAKGPGDDLAKLCNAIPRPLVRSSLYVVLHILRRRDRTQYEKVSEILRRLRYAPGEPGYDPEAAARSLVSRVRTKETPKNAIGPRWALHADFDILMSQLARTPRAEWPGLLDRCCHVLHKSKTLTKEERHHLVLNLANARTCRAAALDLLEAAGWGARDGVAKRLQRLAQPSARERRRPK